MVNNLPVIQETWVWSLGREDPLEKEMVGVETHSSILAWRIPWTEEPGGLHSTGLQWVGLDRVTDTFTTKRMRWTVFITCPHVSFLPQTYQCDLKTSFGPCWFPSVFILISNEWESKAFHLRGDDFRSCQMFLTEESGVFHSFLFILSVCDASCLSSVFAHVQFHLVTDVIASLCSSRTM